jgi:hypothetical protein
MKAREIALWLVLAVGAVSVIAWALPRAVPFFPRDWSVNAQQARAIALEHLVELEELPENPYVVVKARNHWLLEHRMIQALERHSRRELEASPWLRHRAGWEVVVYPPQAPPNEWSHTAWISPQGEIVSLRTSMPAEAEAGELDSGEARSRADELMQRWGFDLGSLGEPELRPLTLARRTDLTLRYPAEERLLGERVAYGVQVHFLGDQLAGFSPWIDDPEQRAIGQHFQPVQFLWIGYMVALFALVSAVAVPFVRKYHAGEVGVHRGVQLFLVVLALGLLSALLSAPAASQGSQMGGVARSNITLITALFQVMFLIFPGALLAALSWTVGESWARERWGRKLAAFDALFRGEWRNSTVARSAYQGVALGLGLLALTLALALPLQAAGVSIYSVGLLEGGMRSSWPGLNQAMGLVAGSLPALLASCLLYPTVLRRFGMRVAGVTAALLAWTIVFPLAVALPAGAGFPLWLVFAAVPVLVFVGFDLLAAIVAGLVARAVFESLPLLLAADPWLQFQGTLPLLLVATPLLLSLRWLQKGEELAYHWDDVPPHVRRIAERERQRVELETAREIQSSILPELPSQLSGIELAHTYQPATEVGGDFYDVLALEDGRLAVAVGDVAGHGVSSGLVMSMVKSALAVQVTFDPEVTSVLGTLNRMVYQSARRRMLTTLSYALVDPVDRTLVYASAGHIFPLRVSAAGRAFELEAGEYPLGVRPGYVPLVRTEKLEAGDYVVLLSDGLVEASPAGSDEPFGFQRLSQSLERHAGGSAKAMLRGMLADLEAFTNGAPRSDDVTVLVLKLP